MADGMKRVDVSPEAFQTVMGLLSRYGGDPAAVERALLDGQKATGAKPKLVVDRISAADVLALFQEGVITKREARAFLGKSGDGGSDARRRQPITRR